MRNNCWQTIGSGGDGSCPELARHEHCHQCHVFTGAAHALLDREVPGEYTDATTRHFAVPAHSASAAHGAVLVFRTGREWLAVPAAIVAEVGHARQIHSLPHRRGHVLGIVNVHGELQVCVSLERLVGAGAAENAPAAACRRFLMIQRGDVRAVCPVDEVAGIERVTEDELQDTPATVAKGAAPFTRKVLNWGGRSVGLLDEGVLLASLKRSFA